METRELLEFMKVAKRSTYAARAERLPASFPESKDLEFGRDPWLYHDMYFGNPTFVGIETIFYQHIPVWAMSYSGKITNPRFTTHEVYEFLREVLRSENPEILPIRGPAQFCKDGWHYAIEISGTIEWFSAHEHISYHSEPVYSGRSSGGTIIK